MKLFCGKCKKEGEPNDMYVCYDCGAYVCTDCKSSEYCPDCNMNLSKLC